ncbi:MAG: hypothetical protein R3208_09400, partial [Ketobacteraceae bacterium]|nr:hypothetical protein [Ketobacteraceae bacterium]
MLSTDKKSQVDSYMANFGRTDMGARFVDDTQLIAGHKIMNTTEICDLNANDVDDQRKIVQRV